MSKRQEKKGWKENKERSKPPAPVYPLLFYPASQPARADLIMTAAFFFSYLCRALPPLNHTFMYSVFRQRREWTRENGEAWVSSRVAGVTCRGCALQPSSSPRGPSDRVFDGSSRLSVRRPSRDRALCGDAVAAGCEPGAALPKSRR